MLAGAICLLIASPVTAAPVTNRAPTVDAKLRFAVILLRHGVRSPTAAPEKLNVYSSEPWPSWGVPPGALTPNGRRLMEYLGAYYRSYFSAHGLLAAKGCQDGVHIHADVEERTRDTGRALARGMMPGCSLDVEVVTGKKDPLFSPLASDIGDPNRSLAVAAIAGRIGGKPNTLIRTYRNAFDTLREVLFHCAGPDPCLAEKESGKTAILEEPSTIETTRGDHAADIRGPLKIASSLSEDLQLEYVNGMEGKDLGWGRLTVPKLLEIMQLHAVYADLARQTPYIARIQGSNLLNHILRSMEQAVDSAPIRGSVGRIEDRVLLLVGHDTNISNLAGMLRISWLLDGYQPNDTPPGGALVFELWQRPDGEFAVRTYFMAQSLQQMHSHQPSSLDSLPLKSPIFIPGCNREDENLTCTWRDFQRVVKNVIDPTFVK